MESSKSFKRKQKRVLRDKEAIKAFEESGTEAFFSFDLAKRIRGRGFFQCDMNYSDCEERGYCNGDC